MPKLKMPERKYARYYRNISKMCNLKRSYQLFKNLAFFNAEKLCHFDFLNVAKIKR